MFYSSIIFFLNLCKKNQRVKNCYETAALLSLLEVKILYNTVLLTTLNLSLSGRKLTHSWKIVSLKTVFFQKYSPYLSD